MQQVDLKWEIPLIGCLCSVRVLSKEYGKLNQYLAGMEMALKSSSPLHIGDAVHVFLKDPFLYLTKWTSLALNHAACASMSTNTMPANNEFILEEGKMVLNSLDESLAFVLQSIFCTNMQKPYTSKDTNSPRIPDHECRSINSESTGRQGAFKHHLPTFFFVFCVKHLSKEAINMLLRYSAPPTERVQEIATGNPDSESTDGFTHCHHCALPLRTISIRVDGLKDESTQVV